MAILLTADQVPPPLGPTSAAALSACTASVTTCPTLSGIAAGSSPFALKFNKALAGIYAAGAFGGLGYGIIEGLTLEDGGDLVALLQPGFAQIGGLVEIATETQVDLYDDTAINYVYLLQNGTTEVVADDPTPPQNEAAYLGAFSTAGGVITSLHDTSGVCYLGSGLMWRETADRGAPADSPTANVRFLTKTQAGTYFWDESAYQPVGTPTSVMDVSATLALDDLDAPMQSLTPLAADRIVTLPPTPAEGARITIVNAGASGGYKLTIQDSGGTEALCTLLPGDKQTFVAASGGESATPEYLLENASHAYTVSALTGTLALSYRSSGMQRVSCAAGQKVLLPDPATVTLGHLLKIYNDNAGAGASITLRDHTDSSTVATIAPDEVAKVTPTYVGGSIGWPPTVGPTGFDD